MLLEWKAAGDKCLCPENIPATRPGPFSPETGLKIGVFVVGTVHISAEPCSNSVNWQLVHAHALINMQGACLLQFQQMSSFRPNTFSVTLQRPDV